jgi:single-stranded-DNA-specific exonuclease
MKTWLEPHHVTVPSQVSRLIGEDSLLSEILVRRGLVDVERIRAFLDPDEYHPASPYDLDDMQAAVDRLISAIKEKQRICVWGDFDVDGQTATTLLVSSLRKLGGNVSYHIPLRSRESHGVNLPVLREIISGEIDVLLTCDTGIGDHQAVEYASSQGVEVIITDHHDLPPQLPPAMAVINPKRGSADHPLAALPGVGVAYELARALFEKMDQPGGADDYLDLVALGIVADLAYQRGEVRYLLQRGLESLRNPQRLALQMMMDIAEIDPAGITEEHIGFELGPRLNALGRLGDANQAVEFLTTKDTTQARLIANYLEGLNAQRKMITSQVYQAAIAQVESDRTLLDYAALVLANPAWPGGVIGIVASKLVERYSRPVLMITAPPGELARGSARSIPGVDISAAIAAQKNLLEGFGGHPMAAGFALQAELIPEFRRAVSETVSQAMQETSFEPALGIDAYLPPSDLSMALVADLERLAPFGPGNPNLVFASQGMRFLGLRSLGRNGDHLQVRCADQGGTELSAIWWGGGIEPQPDWMEEGAAFDLAYSARSRDYKGQPEVQIEWLDARPVEGESIEVLPVPREIEVIDHRDSLAPLIDLNQLLAGSESLVIWAEAQASRDLSEHGIQSSQRDGLEAAGTLAIWTIPPGKQELDRALESVSPQAVHLFGVDPGMDQVKVLTERLLGLAKYALRKTEGRVSTASLAAATAQRKVVVEVGLGWLAARGYLVAKYETRGEVCLSEGDGELGEEFESLDAHLRDLLGETGAFRRYYASADAELLIKQN